MEQPKLVVGFLMDDEMFVKSVKIPKSFDFLTAMDFGDVLDFFEGLLELIAQISEGKEGNESLPLFLSAWRTVAAEAEDSTMAAEEGNLFVKILTDSLQRAMKNTGQTLFVDIDEEEDDEFDSPWIEIVDRQPERRGIMPPTTYGEPFREPVVAEVTEEERDYYLARPLSELGLSTRAHNCLIRENISTLRELVRKADWDLLEYSGFGSGSLHQVKQQLATRGLFLGMDLDDEAYEED